MTEVWRLRDRKTGEWQQHVFFEKIDLDEMIDGRSYELVTMRILAPEEIDGPTKAKCIAAVEAIEIVVPLTPGAPDGASIALQLAIEAIRALPDGGVGNGRSREEGQ